MTYIGKRPELPKKGDWIMSYEGDAGVRGQVQSANEAWIHVEIQTVDGKITRAFYPKRCGPLAGGRYR